MKSEEIRYYRTKATGLISRKYTDFAWAGDDAFEPQDYSLDARVRREFFLVGRPETSLPYVGIISPYVAPPPTPSKTVADIIGACDTGLAHGLSLQCIAKLNRMVTSPLLVELKHPLIDVQGDQINPFLQPAAAAALVRAVESRGVKLLINSCLRTTVQQHIIRTQYEKGLCGITAAALPGSSNHEHGLALDIQDPWDWKDALETQGWVKLGSWDDMHYDFWDGRNDIAKLQISAFQQLWNQYNPSEPIAIDGGYGVITAEKIQRSPVDGWTEPAKKA
jgi:N-acetylmuramoyl-L-alanine amidase